MKKSYIGSWGYRLYKRYVDFVQRRILYRNMYYVGKENVPPLGEPVMVVSNHQNCANDPVVLLFGFEMESHPYVIARANVFFWSVALRKFFFWIGMLPAFRLNYDGAESLQKNDETIRISGGKMLEGNRLIMYPEGGHQDKRWLGDFSYGYTRLAFQTAEKDGFKRDIQILPTANHYSSYFGLQKDVMIRYGKPISLQPFYELYKEKPRTAQREVNRLVREQIQSLMLDIRDLEHYDELDWLRESEYGRQYCEQQHLNPDYLPDKLDSDKMLVQQFAEMTAEQSEPAFEQICEVMAEEKANKVTEEMLQRKPNWAVACLSLIAQVLLLPLWIFSLYPNIFHYLIPKLMIRKDKMFTNSWLLCVPVIVGIPFFFLLTVLVCGLAWGWWWQSIVWMLVALYPLSLFAWGEAQWMKRTMEDFRQLTHSKTIQQIKDKRSKLFSMLNSLLTKNK